MLLTLVVLYKLCELNYRYYYTEQWVDNLCIEKLDVSKDPKYCITDIE